MLCLISTDRVINRQSMYKVKKYNENEKIHFLYVSFIGMDGIYALVLALVNMGCKREGGRESGCFKDEVYPNVSRLDGGVTKRSICPQGSLGNSWDSGKHGRTHQTGRRCQSLCSALGHVCLLAAEGRWTEISSSYTSSEQRQ